MKRWLVMGMVGTALGCGGGRVADKPMLPVTQLPRAVRSAAFSRLPSVRFHTAWRLPNGDYQLRGLDPQGGTVEAEFTADGRLLRPG